MDVVTYAALKAEIDALGGHIDEDVAEATEAWLNENVDPDTGYVLDRTLSMGNAAAPADLVGDLKSALSDITALMNLFDSSTVTLGYRLNTSGTLFAENGYFTSDYISVEVGETYTKNSPIADAYHRWAIYDSSKAFVRVVSDSNTVTIGSGESYVRMCGETADANTTTVLCNSSPTTAIDHVARDSITNFQSVLSETATTTQFANLMYGRRTYINGKILTTGGVLNDNANWITCLDYLPVEAGHIYGFQTYLPKAWLNCLVAWYKSDKTHISNEAIQTNSTGWTAPENAAFARISVVNTTYSSNGLSNFDEAFFAEITNKTYGGRLVHCIDKKFVIGSNIPFMPLYGKKWGMFGDSITEKTNRATVNYSDYIRVDSGCITTNYGISGSGFLSQADVGSAVFQKVKYNESALANFDVITIMAGVNDCMFFQADRLGTADDAWIDTEDFYTNDENSIMACVVKAIQEIRTAAPLVPIGVISPLPVTHTANGTTYDFRPSNEPNKMSAFVDACKEYCASQGIPYLDLFHTSNLMPWDSTQNSTLFKCVSDDSPDGLHPNALGHLRISNAIQDFIIKITK